MLDRLCSEKDEMITQTKRKIGMLLEKYTAKTNIALQKLWQATAELESAKQIFSPELVPYQYYQAVTECQTEYDNLKQYCTEIKEIGERFESDAARYHKKMTEYLESYRAIIKKGDMFLDKYSEFVRKSRTTINDD